MRNIVYITIFLILTAVFLTVISLKSNTQEIWQPAPGTSWQIQYTDRLDTTVPADVYFVDLFDTSQKTIAKLQEQDRRVVCYISAGTYENWRPDAGDFPEPVKGDELGDWPGERWLDIRQLDVLRPIMEKRLTLAVEKGCDGVDPDNVDAYTNETGFPLTTADQLTYNTFLARGAHERGLAIGLKNDLNQVKQLVDQFDFAVNEQCFRYNECEKLTPFIQQNKAVFHVEYELNLENFCPQAKEYEFSSIKKNLSLNSVRQTCESF